MHARVSPVCSCMCVIEIAGLVWMLLAKSPENGLLCSNNLKNKNKKLKKLCVARKFSLSGDDSMILDQ